LHSGSIWPFIDHTHRANSQTPPSETSIISSFRPIKMAPRARDTKGKAPATPIPLRTGTATDQGPSAPIRSNPSSLGSPRALQTQADLDDLATSNNPANRETALTESFVSAIQAFRSSHEMLPAMPTITKLKGRDNYKIWIYEIQSNAEMYGVWDAIVNPDTLLSKAQQAFASAFLFRNTIPSIQMALTAYGTASLKYGGILQGNTTSKTLLNWSKKFKISISWTTTSFHQSSPFNRRLRQFISDY